MHFVQRDASISLCPRPFLSEIKCSIDHIISLHVLSSQRCFLFHGARCDNRLVACFPDSTVSEIGDLQSGGPACLVPAMSWESHGPT